ncbi:MAG TPA: hypothetical protein VN616_01975, partial [Puia sp.]|nr:hypothetical protein [Puia sp.]
MEFHPIRDLVLTLLAGLLSIATHGQGPSETKAGGNHNASVPMIDAGATAQPFAPGIVASRYDEWATSFSPDDKTVYFSRGGYYWTICFSQYKNGTWQRPHVASFSGKWKDTDPFVSPDGKKLFFVSNRPIGEMAGDASGSPARGAGAVGGGTGVATGTAAAERPHPNFHLWYVERLAGGNWGKPHHIGDAVNIDSGNNYGPSVSAKGTLYWCSRNRQGNPGMQGYAATWLGDHYDQPKMVRVPGVNSIQ